MLRDCLADTFDLEVRTQGVRLDGASFPDQSKKNVLCADVVVSEALRLACFAFPSCTAALLAAFQKLAGSPTPPILSRSRRGAHGIWRASRLKGTGRRGEIFPWIPGPTETRMSLQRRHEGASGGA